MSISEWHYVRGDTSVGPVSTGEVEALVAAGQITAQTLVWNDTMPQWEPAGHHFRGFATAAPLAPGGLYPGAPARGFGEAAQVCLSKYATFRGRASRSEYWFFVLFSMLLGAGASFLDLMLFGLQTTGFINGLVSLALFLPSLAVSVRRLHDTDRSGWWIGLFYMLIAAVLAVATYVITSDGMNGESALGSIIMLMVVMTVVMIIYTIVMIVFFCIRGTPGPNRFG